MVVDQGGYTGGGVGLSEVGELLFFCQGELEVWSVSTDYI